MEKRIWITRWKNALESTPGLNMRIVDKYVCTR